MSMTGNPGADSALSCFYMRLPSQLLFRSNGVLFLSSVIVVIRARLATVIIL